MFDQGLAEGLAVTGMVHGMLQGLPHHGGRAHHAVQPRQRHHLQYRRDPTPRLAHATRHRPVELDLAGGIAPVAELVLEALDAHVILGTVVQITGQQEAGHPGILLRQHQMRVAGRRRKEPFVADDLELSVAQLICARGIAANVGAPLLLGHAHADLHAVLAQARQWARIVLPVSDFRHPQPAEIASVKQGRHAGVGHRQRTTGALLGLRVQQCQRRARHVGAGLGRVFPGEARHAVGHGQLHDAVIGRMEFDRVETVPITIVEHQLRLVMIGLETEIEQFATGKFAEGLQLTLGPATAFTVHRVAQGRITGIGVEAA